MALILPGSGVGAEKAMSGWVYAGKNSKKGSSHSTNDDALFASAPGPLSQEGFIALVCDGVSSVPDGKWSAQTTCDQIGSFFEQSQASSPEEYEKEIESISRRIFSEPTKRGACTISLCWIVKGQLHVFALGDTQIALWRKGDLTNLTEDRMQGGRVRYFMGMRDSILPGLQRKTIALSDQDIILIMSDGVSEIVSDRDFSHIWRHCYEDPQLCSEKLVQFAHFSGSTDDNSVIVLQYRRDE